MKPDPGLSVWPGKCRHRKADMLKSEGALFEFRGPWSVPVQVGPSILLLFVLFFGGMPSREYLGFQLAMVAMLLLSIFLHEFGHAWGALIQRVPVRRVVLYGFGGYCEQSRAASPRESELIVAMGPIVTLTLWAVCRLMANALMTAGYGASPLVWGLNTMAWLNGYLAILNLLPIAPLDGGRLFELVLLRVMPARRAARITGYLGMALLILVTAFFLFYMRSYIFLLFVLPGFAVNLAKLRGQG